MPQVRVAVPNQALGFRFKIQAIEAADMPLKIFAHQQAVESPHSATVKEEFVFVCSAFDLTLYPADEPDTTQSPAYYRKDLIDVVVASQAMADEFWDAVKQEVCNLVKALNAMDVLVVAEDYVCGEQDSEEDSDESE